MQSTRPRQLSAAAMHHYAFRNQILAAHPQLRRLYGAEPRQLLMVVLLLTARWGLAWALADAPLLLIGALACTVGCWLVHGLGTYAHEQAHRLIVAREPAASAVDLLIECGMTSFGKMVAYQYRHVNFHHRYLGDYEWDSEVRDLCAHVVVVEAADRAALASRALQLLEGTLAVVLPAGGLVAQDVAEALRGVILPDVSASDAARKQRFALPPNVERKANWFAAASLGCYLLTWWLWGWRAMLFALWSLSVKASRFDVIGWGQDMAEHNADDAAPTNSTYTLWNLLFSNTGYHNEHHTFPSVPGCRLPEITAAAPEAFKPTENPTPWAVLWARWAAAGFRSVFRLSDQQKKLARAGRCHKGRGGVKAEGPDRHRGRRATTVASSSDD